MLSGFQSTTSTPVCLNGSPDPSSEMLDLGVSPRATLSLFRAAQALALTEERSYCIPDDIKRLVLPVFAHRILVSTRYASSMRRSEEAEAVLTEIMKTVSVPL